LEWIAMMLAVVSSATKSRGALQLENLALRHQIGVLQRSAKKRLSLNNADRLFLDWAVARVGGVALGLADREARQCYCQASEGIPEVLDLESSARPARTAGGLSGDSRADPPHEPRESWLGRTAYSR
jgi:hypothetical protein